MNIWIPASTFVAGAAVVEVASLKNSIVTEWMPAVTALILLATPVVTAFAARIAAKRAVKEEVQAVVKEVKVVVKQNEKQEQQIDEVKEDQKTQHAQWNSRLDEFKAELEDKAALAIEAAVKRGVVLGIEQERSRVQTTAERVVKVAESVAKEVLAAAAEVKEQEKK